MDYTAGFEGLVGMVPEYVVGKAEVVVLNLDIADMVGLTLVERKDLESCHTVGVAQALHNA